MQKILQNMEGYYGDPVDGFCEMWNKNRNKLNKTKIIELNLSVAATFVNRSKMWNGYYDGPVDNFYEDK